VLSDFQTTVLIMRKRELSEMRSEEARHQLRLNTSPAIEVKASFDTEILLQLKPAIFLKLCLMPEVLMSEGKPEQYYVEKMNKKL
jgi:hypothetical protein